MTAGALMTDQMNAMSRSWWARGGKRVFDFTAALLGVIVVSPVLLLAAGAIAVLNPGPILFTQDRGGMGSKSFRLYKFRTMSAGRKPDPKELVPLDHPEITRLGRLLRRTKVDELPQLFNVLKGDMSLVGPRPTLPDQVAAYDDFRRQRMLVRPGISGLAQVHGATALSWDERILYDIVYVRRCSLGLDLAILLRTAWVVVLGEERTQCRFLASKYAGYVTIPPGYSVDGGSKRGPGAGHGDCSTGQERSADEAGSV